MEVLVEILLALLAQPSHLIRQVARSVFSHVCAHLTPRALQLILDVSWGLWGNGSQEVAAPAPGLPHQPLVLTVTCRVRGGPSLCCCAALIQEELALGMEGVALPPGFTFLP